MMGNIGSSVCVWLRFLPMLDHTGAAGGGGGGQVEAELERRQQLWL